MSFTWLDGLVSLGVFTVVLGAAAIGWALGRRRPKQDGEVPGLGTIQGGTLGLLGLLLGFAFAGASSRFNDRQQGLTLEANAISTAFLRADLMDLPSAAATRDALRDYTRLRLTLFSSPPGPEHQRLLDQIAQTHSRLWNAATTAARVNPTITQLVIPAANDVMDLLAIRHSFANRHLPVPVLLLLLICAAASTSMVGFAAGVARARSGWAVCVLAALIAVSLWLTIDLDFPTRGLLRLDDSPLRDVLAQIDQPATAPPSPSSR